MVPAVTVIVAGLKAIPWIQTSLVPGPVVVPVFVLFDVPDILSIDFLQPVTLRIAKTIAILNNNLFLEATDVFIIVIIWRLEHPGSGFVQVAPMGLIILFMIHFYKQFVSNGTLKSQTP